MTPTISFISIAKIVCIALAFYFGRRLGIHAHTYAYILYVKHSIIYVRLGIDHYRSIDKTAPCPLVSDVKVLPAIQEVSQEAAIQIKKSTNQGNWRCYHGIEVSYCIEKDLFITHNNYIKIIIIYILQVMFYLLVLEKRFMITV